MKNDVSVAGLVGLSFSGSTVLNYVLGSHQGVYGGSEIYRLIAENPVQRCGCSWCHDGCRVLTPERIGSLDKDNFYTSLAEFTGKRKIVDTSKNLPWFEEIFPRQAAQRVSPILVLLTKHPMRQLAAFMGWEGDYLYRCGMKSVIKRMILDPATAFDRQKMHLSYWLDNMADFYRAFEASPLLATLPHFRIKYEDFVERTPEALKGVLDYWGLEFDPRSIDYSSFEQHGVGGNGGVIRMINTEERVERFRARSAEYILDYYDNCEGLTLDNSYRDAFTASLADWIKGLPKYKDLCAMLGYEGNIDCA